MEEGDQPKSRERILWKSAKIGGKEGRLNSSFKGLNCRKYQEDFKGKQRPKLPNLLKEERRR